MIRMSTVLIARQALVALLLVAVLVAAGCVSAPARPRTLYDQLGGKVGVHAVTESMLDAFANDDRMRPFFAHVDINRFSREFSVFVCQLADGPCHYSVENLAEVHRGMNIGPTQFNAVVENLIKAMDAQHVPVPVQNRQLARMAPLRGQVMHR